MMNNRTIAISRQYGSGGREIGARLAERLGIPFYDKEIIALAAKQSGVSGELFGQPEQAGSFILRDFSSGPPLGLSLGDRIYLAQHTVILALAQKGPCVIVGRGAGGTLRDAAPLMYVFVYASMESRKRRAIEEYGDPAHKIEKRMGVIDKKRAAYFRFYTGMDGMRMENYHLCVDSGAYGIKNAVTLIETAYLLGNS